MATIEKIVDVRVYDSYAPSNGSNNISNCYMIHEPQNGEETPAWAVHHGSEAFNTYPASFHWHRRDIETMMNLL